MAICRSSVSSRSSRFARRSRMSSPVAVKNLTGIARMHASLPNATARWVLPMPSGPYSTVLTGAFWMPVVTAYLLI